MLLLLATIVFSVLAILTASGFGRKIIAEHYHLEISEPFYRSFGLLLFSSLAVVTFLMLSMVVIDQDRVGHLKRIYLGKPLPEGRVIALPGEQGPQAEILGPGFYVIPFVNLLFTVEQLPLVDIPEGKAGILVAKDGKPLKDNEFVSKVFAQNTLDTLINAVAFLKQGGQRGPQLAYLSPGKYRLNQYLFDVTLVDALDVPRGTVAVIKSNVNERDDCKPVVGAAALPLVAKGCAGVQSEPLMPGRYYLNTIAYNPTIVPTTIQALLYKGGFESRQISLAVDSEGNISQVSKPYSDPVPPEAVDRAVVATIEGWRVPIEVRILIQVTPEDAAKMVALVGSIPEVEKRIATPALRSVVRNVTGAEDRKILDLINKRQELEKAVEAALGGELAKAGVTLKEVRFGDPVIPPELLVTRQREQLATQLGATYEQERQAQLKRAEVERARAEAVEQPRLVAAEFNVKIAEQSKLQLQLQGEGEKLRLIEIAAGQKAQVDVLGQESALQLAMLKEILAAAAGNPNIVKVPTVSVVGSSNSLEGAAAVLGSSNIVNWLRPPTPSNPPQP
jgi:hypothetical protein